MPPFQSRSTGARRIARISSFGEQPVGLDAERRATCGESGIDLAVRANTPPPVEISASS